MRAPKQNVLSVRTNPRGEIAVMREFMGLLRDADPNAMKIAEDLLLENSISLVKAGQWPTADQMTGRFVLASPDPISHYVDSIKHLLPLDGYDDSVEQTESGWSIEKQSATSFIVTLNYTYGGQPGEILSGRYYRDLDAAQRVAAADAWVLAKSLKGLDSPTRLEKLGFDRDDVRDELMEAYVGNRPELETPPELNRYRLSRDGKVIKTNPSTDRNQEGSPMTRRRNAPERATDRAPDRGEAPGRTTAGGSTSTSTDVRSPTSTSTEVRSPTSTSTEALTAGNVTVTGGAGNGATTSVTIYTQQPPRDERAPECNPELPKAYMSSAAPELPAAQAAHGRTLGEYAPTKRPGLPPIDDAAVNPRSVLTGPRWDDARAKLRGAAVGARKNPTAPKAAVDKYEEFHRYKPIAIDEFPKGFDIPKKMFRAGPAKWTTYRSSKVDPSTLEKPRRPVNYIHEHDAGVHVYLTPNKDNTELLVHQLGESDELYDVPRAYWDPDALVKLGDSLGFCFTVDGEDQEAESTAPLPELYCTPDGKCLLVIQDKREVLAMLWGGGLGVFARGIDG